MRLKTWPVAALGLGSLLLLIVVSMLASSRKAQDIYTQLDQLNTYHHNVDAKLRRLRSDVHLSGIFVRDYLLDIERERAPEYRQRLAEFRQTNMATVAELRAFVEGHEEQILSLQTKLDDYWETFDPLFDWTPTEKIFRSAGFLRREVVPRREAVLTIAQEIEELNNANLAEQRAEVTRRHAAFRDDLDRLLWRSLLLGLAVALDRGVPSARARAAVRGAAAVAQEAEHQMRELSQRLVATQEEERKNLSRELHDHVGQVLTALRMELGRIERTRAPATAGSARRSANAGVSWTAWSARSGISRSAFGRACWTTSACSRRWNGTSVTSRAATASTSNCDCVEISTRLPDVYRTCVYRAVQEALTNCIRHAEARSIDGDGRRSRRSHCMCRSPTMASGFDSARAARRARSARNRGARQGTSRRDDDRQRAGRRHEAGDPAAVADRPTTEVRACACCWLTTTASSAAD